MDKRKKSSIETKLDMMESDIVSRISEFMENEARSCSMDFGCVTPEYVYRMWGGSVPLEDIKSAMLQIQ